MRSDPLCCRDDGESYNVTTRWMYLHEQSVSRGLRLVIVSVKLHKQQTLTPEACLLSGTIIQMQEYVAKLKYGENGHLF